MSPAAAAATTTTTSSSRWSPTAEQLMILEEMYRRGITTPKASQIQHITSYLSHFGKIEGKNVFYWFQNHKARDRQKLRRQLIAIRQQQQQQQQQQEQQEQLLHQQHSTLMPTMTSHQYNHHQYLIHDQYYCNYNTSITNNTIASGSSAFQPLSVYNSFTKYFPDQGLSWSTEKILEVDDIDERQHGGGGGECSCCIKPVRTLELFPTKSSSSIKDEYNLTTTSKRLSCFSTFSN